MFGTKYQVPFAIVVGKDDDHLQFGSVTRILVDRGVVLFEFVLLKTHQFFSHYHAYGVKLPSMSSRINNLIKQSELIDYHPFGLYHSYTVSECTNLQYIVLRGSVYRVDDYL